MTDPSSSLEYLLSRLDASPDPQFVDSLETALVNSFADLESRRAYIETAVHHTDSEKSAIISLLKDRFPQVLGTSFSVNPRLIGGLVIKVGDERLDYSLASQLANMQKGFI